ncbi:hypothetical protein GGX14DRAFT_662241 [Mycena pura]|uniref:Uncharacterized protein n=1 Tax=Mycena pura TaxID=153505 RepID=A0AAD6V0N7_9AGAR|nr:hypothetical protein GGX14DRAFT_662241 [Mycena pura]
MFSNKISFASASQSLLTSLRAKERAACIDREWLFGLGPGTVPLRLRPYKLRVVPRRAQPYRSGSHTGRYESVRLSIFDSSGVAATARMMMAATAKVERGRSQWAAGVNSVAAGGGGRRRRRQAQPAGSGCGQCGGQRAAAASGRAAGSGQRAAGSGQRAAAAAVGGQRATQPAGSGCGQCGGQRAAAAAVGGQRAAGSGRAGSVYSRRSQRAAWRRAAVAAVGGRRAAGSGRAAGGMGAAMGSDSGRGSPAFLGPDLRKLPVDKPYVYGHTDHAAPRRYGMARAVPHLDVMKNIVVLTRETFWTCVNGLKRGLSSEYPKAIPKWPFDVGKANLLGNSQK